MALLAGLVGLVTGIAAVTAFRFSERAHREIPAQPEPVIPPGVATVLSVLPFMAVVMDAQGLVLRASPAAYAVGIIRGDRLVPGELVEMVRAVRRDGEIRHSELELPRGWFGRRRDAQEISVDVRVAPLGTEGLVLLLVEDRTEARRVDAVRRDFVANVSHELKTPLGALGLLAEAVLDAAGDAEDGGDADLDAVRHFASRLQRESTRLSRLVQDLIDLSRLQVDDPLAEATTVRLDEVVSEAVERSEVAAEARDIKLTTGGEPGLTVYGNQPQLVTALLNLIENAVSYSRAGAQVAVATRRAGDRGISGGIGGRTRGPTGGRTGGRTGGSDSPGGAGVPAGDIVEITVTDEGVGIPEHDLNRIFERFYRVDSARSRETGGTGLGLAIVKHVVTGHGGEVSVWSSEGSGSTFTMRLPAHHPDRRSPP